MQATIHNEFFDPYGGHSRRGGGQRPQRRRRRNALQADKSVWGRHAPILFPWTGKLAGGILDPRRQELQGRPARLCPGSRAHAAGSRPRHHPHGAAGRRLRSRRPASPYDFVLTSTFRLEGKTVCHTLTVENPAGAAEPCPLASGITRLFNVPFDDKHTIADYEFRFDRPESPVILTPGPNGLLSASAIINEERRRHPAGRTYVRQRQLLHGGAAQQDPRPV